MAVLMTTLLTCTFTRVTQGQGARDDQFGHSLALCQSGTVIGFGVNEDCQLGVGSNATSPYEYPHQVNDIVNAISVAAGQTHSLALLDDGRVMAWGTNGFGEAGQPTSSATICDPTEVELPGCATAISAGNGFSLALLADSSVWAWGLNGNGQLGNGDAGTSTYVPDSVLGGVAGVIAISAGDAHAMALLANGTVKVWGYGRYGQMGNGTSGSGANTNDEPVTAFGSGFSGIVQIDAGNQHCVTRKNNGDIYVWGYNQDGQLGQGNTTASDTAIISSGLSSSSTIDISAGVGFTIVLKSNGTTKATGFNASRELGNCSYAWDNYTTPISGPTIANCIDICTPSTASHTLAVTSNGNLYGWGDDSKDQLGVYTDEPHHSCSLVLINDPDIVWEDPAGYYCPAKPSSDNHPQPCCVAIRDDERTTIGDGATIAITTDFTGQYLALSGTLNITGGMTTFEDCDIVCLPGSKIIVNEGFLNIDDESHLYACSEMWDGIIVKNKSVLYVTESAIIEDAITAIDLEYGAYYKIEDAIFNKNKTHVSLHMPSSGTPTYTGDYRIKRSRFLCQTTASIPTIGSPVYTNLLAPHATERTNAAITAVGVPKILLGSSSASDANTVDNCGWGMFNWTVDRIEALNDTFREIENTGVYCGVGAGNGGETIDVSYNTIERTRYGIFCYDNDTTVRAHITHNVIDFAGMAATPYEKVGITYEEITPATAHNTANFVDISFDTILNAPCGIELINLQGDLFTTDAALYVGNNYITHTKHSSYGGAAGIKTNQVIQGAFVSNEVTHPAGAVNYWESGLRLSGGSANAIICNNTHDVGRGLYFGLRQTPDTDVINNTMENNQTGIYMAWSVIGHQGSVGNPRDNTWLGSTWNSSNPNTFVESRDGDDSRFYVRDTPSVPSDYIPQFNESGGSGTDLAITQTSGSWPGGCVYTDGASFKTEGAQSSNETLTSLLNAAAVEEMETDRDRSQNYTGLYNIYNRLLADPELIASEPTLEDFFTESNNSNMGVLRRTIAGYSAATKGEADATTLTALQTLQPENLVEQTLKDVFGILYINATALAEMKEDDEAQLRKIAQLCPIDYGFGVFTARAALVTLDTLPKHYIAECEREVSPEQIRGKRDEQNLSRGFSFYPNPSRGLLTVAYALEPEESGQILVLDLSGRQIRSVALDAASTSLELDLQDISSGLYFLQIGINGNIRDSERVSILKP